MDLNKYSKALSELNVNYESQRNRLDAYKKGLFTFKDETKIEWSTEQKKKAIEEAKEDVVNLEKIVETLKESLT